MSTSTAPQPCQHKRAAHTHGTRACYVLDRCRCEHCGAANRAVENTRARQMAYGRWAPYVEAAPARAHVRHLMDAGIGMKRVAAITGVPHGSLWKLVYGKPGPDGVKRPSVRVRTSTADRLLAIRFTAPDLARGARVDATGTHRRLQALIAAGWSQSKLAVRLGMNPSNFNSMLSRDAVTVARARAVAALFDALWDVPPPQAGHRDKIAVSRSRNYARARGWVPALGWDEDSIDDPTAHPSDPSPDPALDEVMVARFMAGTLTPTPRAWSSPELIEAITRLVHTQRSDAQIGDLIGSTRDAVKHLRDRHGITRTQPQERTA